VKARLHALYGELFARDGYRTLRVELRILCRGQKEVILDCGKQYGFVVDLDMRAAHRIRLTCR
jgi:hypothetical protein